MKNEQIVAVILHHQEMMEEKNFGWDQMRRLRDAFGDNLWGASDGHAGAIGQNDAGSYPVKPQTNHVRPGLYSFMNSLFYNAPRVSVTPDVNNLDPDAAKKGTLIAMIADAWLRRADITEAADQACALALMDGCAGFTVGCDANEPAGDILSRVWAEAIAKPYALWDETAPSSRRRTWEARLVWVAVDDFAERYGVELPKGTNTRSRPTPQDSDPKKTDDQPSPTVGKLPQHVLVCEFLDHDDTFEVAAETPEGIETRQFPGKLKMFIVAPGMKEPFKEMMAPYTFRGRGSPLVIPVVPTPVPGTPLKGVSRIEAIWQNSMETNLSRRIIANKVRRTAADKVTYPEGLSGDKLSKLQSAVDNEFVAMTDDEAQRIRYLERPDVDPMLTKYIELLAIDQDAVSRPPLSRGEALKYATAAEIGSLNAESENEVGEIKKHVSDTIEELIQTVLVILAHELIDAGMPELQINTGSEVVSIDAEALLQPWVIKVVDRAATPLTQMQRRGEFLQVLPVLTQLAQAVAGGGIMAGMVPAAWDYVVEQWGLPETFRFDHIQAAAPPPPPSPEPAPPEPTGIPSQPGVTEPQPPQMMQLPPGVV